VTHQWAACDAASVHFGPTVTWADMLVCANVVVYGKVYVNKEKVSVVKTEYFYQQSVNCISIQKKT